MNEDKKCDDVDLPEGDGTKSLEIQSATHHLNAEMTIINDRKNHRDL